MSGRVHVIQERHDKTWYDTITIEPGQEGSLFDSKGRNDRLGDRFKTNLSVPYQINESNPYLLMAIGARAIGKTRQEEDLLFDHLYGELVIGDVPRFDFLGTQLSMLRHVFSKEELEKLEVDARAPWGPRSPGEEQLRVSALPFTRVGYHFGRALVIRTRMSYELRMKASKQLPEAVNLRVYLFGLTVKDVP